MYNKQYHIYIPSTDEIKSMTGIDLILEEGNKERAEAKVLSFTLKAKQHLFNNKIQETRNIISYLIAFDEEWKHAWLEYVATYIESFFYAGDFVWGSEKMPSAVERAITGGLLKVKTFEYRIINEVNNSSKEW